MKILRIYSMGHSNLVIDEFINILTDLNIKMVLDVRSTPYSKFRHFNQINLRKSIQDVNINYIYMGKLLGGRNDIKYPFYVNTKVFKVGIDRLIRFAKMGNLVFMCSERDSCNCHRKYISEHLLKKNFQVYDISWDSEKNIRISKHKNTTPSCLNEYFIKEYKGLHTLHNR